MRKPDFCICENKDAYQFRGNRKGFKRIKGLTDCLISLESNIMHYVLGITAIRFNSLHA